MDSTDKNDIIEAIGALAAHVDGRFDAMETCIDDMEGRVDALTKEVRSGYEKLGVRLSSVEDEVKAISTTLDKQLEGNALGKDHITLTRKEYDVVVDAIHLTNSFTAPAR
jgi:hypothetical protein